MRIEDYFGRVQQQIDACPMIQLSNVNLDKRGNSEGLLRGELIFIDGSELHFREYVDVETRVERLMYVYQYLDGDKGLIFRYDNSGHHREIPTFPHHKHVGEEAMVMPGNAPEIGAVLQEIQDYVKLI